MTNRSKKAIIKLGNIVMVCGGVIAWPLLGLGWWLLPFLSTYKWPIENNEEFFDGFCARALIGFACGVGLVIIGGFICTIPSYKWYWFRILSFTARLNRAINKLTFGQIGL